MYAFTGCSSLTDIYYGGSESQWNQVFGGYYTGSPLYHTNIHYNSTGSASTTTAPVTGTMVHVSTSQELSDALSKSNVTIVLEGKDYTTDYMFGLSDVENVTIQGTAGTRLLSTASDSVVVWMSDCQNIVLDNLVIGHDIAASEYGCTDGVIHSGDTTLTITNCDIFGCGLVGIGAYGSTITVENSTIRDCSKQILDLSRGATVFRNCVFSGMDTKNRSNTRFGRLARFRFIVACSATIKTRNLPAPITR